MAAISIIIVNWNSGKQLYECIRSISNAERKGIEMDKIVVVDNASKDDSLLGIEVIELPLYIIKNPTNRGFAAACNQGADVCTSDYLLFLNPDVVLFKDSLRIPVDFMEEGKNRNVGIVGIQLVNQEGEIAHTCVRFPTLAQFISNIFGLQRLLPSVFPGYFMSEWNHKEDRLVDHVIGAFFLVRREQFTRLGGFDERFFVYLEDLDFSYRMRHLGYYSYYLTLTQAYHKGGGSSEEIKDIRLFYSLRSRILYGYKHFSWIAATILAICTLTIEPITRVIFAAVKGSFSDIAETLRAYKLLWAAVPRLILDSSRLK